MICYLGFTINIKPFEMKKESTHQPSIPSHPFIRLAREKYDDKQSEWKNSSATLK